jgi:hypothetical protein
MPIHDWTRVDAGTVHAFHQDWTIEICRTLNRGVVPLGYFAMPDQRVMGPEPDVIALKVREPATSGGLAVAEAYARKANRIAVRHKLGPVVPMIEVVSPGNKDSARALRSFLQKAIEFLQHGISLVVVDLFPPTRRDPDGIHQALWDELVGTPFEPRPPDKPLTVASYDPGDGLTTYVNPVAVGDPLPDAPLFLAPGRYVNIPLETTYAASWAVTPQPIRDLVEAPPAAEKAPRR